MATVLTSSQQTFVDITDQRKLSAYIASNLPKTQSEDPNVLPHTYAPNWSANNLKLTPVVFLDQTNLALDASGLTISWKRKDGTGAETALTSGESVSGGILTVNANKLADSSSGMITYLCYISYYDAETKNTVNISADITYTLVRNAENARLAYVMADTYVFKYDARFALVGASQATLTAQVQGVNIAKWQYKNSSGEWADYPATSDNSSITGGTLVVKPAHSVFVGNVAQIKLVTDDPDVYDTVSITKMYDGSQGEPGSAGTGGLSVILGNEAQAIACTSGGLVAATMEITIPFTAYTGITQVACTCTVETLPSGVTVKSNTAATASAAGSVVLAVAANATLGGAAVLNGTVDLTFTVSGASVTKQFSWSKSNRGSNGASGANAIVFSVYAPEGTVVMNQSGSLSLAAAGYDGASEITTGTTYQWARYTGGQWVNISGATSSTLAVSGSDIVNIFETAPSSPKSGDLWYQIDHTAKTVTLMKYNGSAWTAATETQELTYTWYAQDKDGQTVEFEKTGKVIYLSAADIDSILTLQCDVSN